QGGFVVFFFFFFQAEDGIRDGHVTGVQTCALPISGGLPAKPTGLPDRYSRRAPAAVRLNVKLDSCGPWRRSDRLSCEAMREERRSEERRVGKECRSRWWRERYKKNEEEGIGGATQW